MHEFRYSYSVVVFEAESMKECGVPTDCIYLKYILSAEDIDFPILEEVTLQLYDGWRRCFDSNSAIFPSFFFSNDSNKLFRVEEFDIYMQLINDKNIFCLLDDSI